MITMIPAGKGMYAMGCGEDSCKWAYHVGMIPPHYPVPAVKEVWSKDVSDYYLDLLCKFAPVLPITEAEWKKVYYG
jgi:hypothetical protein